MNAEEFIEKIKLCDTLSKICSLYRKYQVAVFIQNQCIICKLNNSNNECNLQTILSLCINYGFDASKCKSFDDVIVLMNNIMSIIWKDVDTICMNEAIDRIQKDMIRGMFGQAK